MASKVRLYVDHPLGQGKPVPLTGAQAHYLFWVMRLGIGAILSLFNGRDGEWDGAVAEAGKKGGSLVCQNQTRPLQMPPDLWLLFAPLKKARTDFVVEKAVELGVARIMPVQTDYTNADRVRQDKMQAHAIEAAEQCGATFVPPVDDLCRLDKILHGWPVARHLMFCDERLIGQAAGLTGAARGPWAILIGPEGGFSPAERNFLHGWSSAHPVALGPRILRADTAAVVALTLWQQALGDW